MKRTQDKQYMLAVKNLPCAVCKRPPPSDCHHAQGLEFGCGMGRKSSDYDTIPLCKAHHQFSPNAFHVMGKRAWEGKFGTQRSMVEQTQAILSELLLQ